MPAAHATHQGVTDEQGNPRIRNRRCSVRRWHDGHDRKRAEQVKCGGINSCKGQSACKMGASSCKGQNACKGQGWSEQASASDCTSKGGKIL